MKFGIFQELEHPRPWVEGGERRLFEEALEQVELADRLGLDAAKPSSITSSRSTRNWLAPEVFLAAAATRTKTIRLGHGVCLLPVNYNHPARGAAERAATLDVISGGRVELGTGESNSRIELEGFGVDPSTKRAQWTEVVEQVANMLAMDPYPGFEGEFFSMPARNVVPKPLQKPHPPLWVACSQKETIHLAARLGLGALAFTFLKPEDARTLVDDYYETFRNECVPIGQAVNPNIALVTGFGVHPDEDEAARRFVDGIRFFQFALDHYYRSGVHKPGRTDLWGKYLADREALAATEIDPKVADLVLRRVVPWQSLGAIGTVEQVRARIRSFAEIGVDQLLFIQQGGEAGSPTSRNRWSCSSARSWRSSGRATRSDSSARWTSSRRTSSARSSARPTGGRSVFRTGRFRSTRRSGSGRLRAATPSSDGSTEGRSTVVPQWAASSSSSPGTPRTSAHMRRSPRSS